jgi:hypothetical protein
MSYIQFSRASLRFNLLKKQGLPAPGIPRPRYKTVLWFSSQELQNSLPRPPPPLNLLDLSVCQKKSSSWVYVSIGTIQEEILDPADLQSKRIYA